RIGDRTGWAGLRRARSPRPLSEQIEAHVRGDPVEPGAKRRPAVESVETSPCANHGLLHGVIGIDGRSHHPVTMTGQSGAVLLELGGANGHSDALTNRGQPPSPPRIATLLPLRDALRPALGQVGR